MARDASDRRDPDVRRWTGISAIAVAVTLLLEAFMRLYTGARPSLHDPEALTEFFERNSTALLVVIMCDTILMSAIVVFLGCFRQLMTEAREGLRWIADIGFGAGLVYVAVTLVGDAMAGGVALEAAAGDANPVIVRALIEGHVLMFGTVGCILTVLVVASGGYLAFASGALPRWTGWVAYVTAALNLATIPTIFGGTDETSLFSVGGWANAVLATFPWLLWVIIVGIVTIRGERHHRKVQAQAVPA